MKKIFTFFLAAVSFISLSYAKKVDVTTAKIVGQQFMITKAVESPLTGISNISLTYTSYTTNTLNAAPESDVNYYIFNVNSNQGFVIVSGDDIVEPIIGYSNQKSFDANNIPPHVAAWLKVYADQIRFAVDRQMQPTPVIRAKWELYKTSTIPSPVLKSPQVVAPLLQTTWNQSPFYNDLCPYDNQAQDRTVTGCVATAMAQVLKYWNSPVSGAGFHSYNDPKYGAQSADFGSTTYSWNSMPLVLNGPNSAIATLMYHCGVSVDMTYGVAATGGSSAYVVSTQSPVTNCAEYALKTYFGYPSTLNGKVRQNYDDNTWQNMMKADLDASRPIIYAGFGSGGGHCFVCDGYDNNGMFHFNWGWQGQFDGYFAINAMNPEGTGTGGGTGGFNSGQQAVFGIQGGNGGGGGGGGGNQNYGLALYSTLNISASPVNYGTPFTVSTDIANFGPGTFQGTVCAAIFDASSAFIDFVDSIPALTYDSGYYYTTSFNYPGKFTLLPGTYYIATFYKAAGGNWKLVGNYQNYTNLLQVQVVNSNTIEMNAAMTVTPGTTLTAGQQVSVHLDVVNNGSFDFTGIFDVSLYNTDGFPVATIQQLTGMNLPAGYHYTNGLTFTNSSLNCSPGTYLMALQYLPDNGSAWSLTGSTNYQNPIAVIVQEATLNQDVYEPNNTPAQAYALPLNFSGNTANVSTPGANCNSGTDYDFYTLILPQGNSYSISARVDDAVHNTGGGTYTLDAIWIDSVAGSPRSPVYDDVDPDNIILLNGGTVYFEAGPKFTGNTGTYNLVLTITRNPLGIVENSLKDLLVYPNPAADWIYLVPGGQQGWPSRITVNTVEGRLVKDVSPGTEAGIIKIGVSDLQDGLYLLEVFMPAGVITKEVVIRK